LTTADDKGVKKIDIQHQPGPDIIRILAERINSTIEGAIREAISNGFDAESTKVLIYLKQNKLIIEDWGTGIKDHLEFAYYGYLKKDAEGRQPGKEKTIGKYHFGKLSYFKLSDPVIFHSNNGKVGYALKMSKTDGFQGVQDSNNPSKHLKHQGVQIVIYKPNIGDYKDFNNRLYSYLLRTFALKTTREDENGNPKYQIKLNGKEIIGNKLDFQPEEVVARFNAMIEDLSTGQMVQREHMVTGSLRKGGKGYVDVYCRDIFVARIPIDQERDFTGWVNCDVLTPTVGRNEFDEDDTYRTFLAALRKYAKRKFLKREVEITQSAKIAGNLFKQLGDKWLDMFQKTEKISTGDIAGNGGEKERRDEDDQKGTVEPKDTDRTRKPIKTQPSNEKGGLTIIHVKQGDEQLPLYPHPDKEKLAIFWNDTNKITRYCIMLNETGKRGAVNTRLMPYFARALAAFRTEYGTWSEEERQKAADDATRYMMRSLLTTQELEKLEILDDQSGI
jgi:Histidine kinase-, DNA gyrase B-, and HSP90-like ATPase